MQQKLNQSLEISDAPRARKNIFFVFVITIYDGLKSGIQVLIFFALFLLVTSVLVKNIDFME